MVVVHTRFCHFYPKHTHSHSRTNERVYLHQKEFYSERLYAWRLRWCYWVNIHNYLDSRYETQYIHLMKLCKCGSKRSSMFSNNNGVFFFLLLLPFSLHMWCDKSCLVCCCWLEIFSPFFEHRQNISRDESKISHILVQQLNFIYQFAWAYETFSSFCKSLNKYWFSANINNVKTCSGDKDYRAEKFILKTQTKNGGKNVCGLFDGILMQ